jgi:hypothetical protein
MHRVLKLLQPFHRDWHFYGATRDAFGGCRSRLFRTPDWRSFEVHQMKNRVLLCIFSLFIASCGAGTSVSQESKRSGEANDAGAGLRDGWRQEIEIPAVKISNGDTFLRPSKVVLWVEQGWLCGRRTDADEVIEWQVVLAQPMAAAVPAVETDERGGLAIAYGNYFIRENLGQLRILRQRKDAPAPTWPKLEMSHPIERKLGYGRMPAKLVEIKAFVSGGWCWVTSGPANDRPDLWLRLERQELQKPGYGFESGHRPARMFFGNHHAIDEGDLFVATRSARSAYVPAGACPAVRPCLLHLASDCLSRLHLGYRPMFRFTIRDVLWLTVLVAVLCAWWLDHRVLAKRAWDLGWEVAVLKAKTVRSLTGGLFAEDDPRVAEILAEADR